MSPNKGWMTDFSNKCSKDIVVVDDSKIPSGGVGDVIMNFESSDKIVSKTVKDVIYAPTLTTNLLSVSRIAEKKRYLVTFDRHGCKVYDENLVSIDVPELSGTLKGGLYVADQRTDVKCMMKISFR
jgi:hypothetical protein